MGERLRGELQREAAGRAAGSGGLLHLEGGGGGRGAVEAGLQPGQAPQLPGVPPART